MDAMEQFSEVFDVLAALAPITANGAVGAHVTGYFSLADAHRAFGFLHLGTPAQGATIDVSMQQATDAFGTGAKALAGKAPTQLVAGDSGGYVGIELQSEELDVTNGYEFAQVTVTVGTDTYTYSLVVFGGPLRYAPADVTDFIEVVV